MVMAMAMERGETATVVMRAGEGDKQPSGWQKSIKRYQYQELRGDFALPCRPKYRILPCRRAEDHGSCGE